MIHLKTPFGLRNLHTLQLNGFGNDLMIIGNFGSRWSWYGGVTNRILSQFLFLLPSHSRCPVFFSLDHTQTHTTVGRTPLDEGSSRRRDLYLTTQTLYKRRISMPPVGFEPTIPASARPQIYALDGAVTGVSPNKSSFQFCKSYALPNAYEWGSISVKGRGHSVRHRSSNVGHKG
jgi:hypothetical protein